MKILFIIHSGNLVYGAAKSIGYVLKNTTVEYDVIFSPILRFRHSMAEIKEFAGEHCGQIYFYNLPNESEIVFPKSPPRTLLRFVLRFFRLRIQRLLAYIDRPRIYKLIEKNHYDIVHLNVSVLYPLITEQYNFVLHARELFSGVNAENYYKKLSKLKGLICIDVAVKNSIHINLPYIILNNPFCMLDMQNVNTKEVKLKYGINLANTIFAIIGTLTEPKGVMFTIKAIMEVEASNITFLVVGKINSNYAKQCVEFAKNDPRIVFLGEITDINNVYAITDYVIRGDQVFCIGRTVYEGLYAGCGVLIQGTKADLETMPQYELFRDKLHCYSPRDEQCLAKQVNFLSQRKITNRTYYSNVDNYIKQFESFLHSVADREREGEKC